MIKTFFKKLLIEDNLRIIIFGVLVTLVLTGYLIFGLSNPKTVTMMEKPSQIQLQQDYENTFLNEVYSGNYTAENPYFILDPYKISPLSGLIIFETEKTVSYKIVVLGKTNEGNMEFTSPATKSHFIPVYGLYAGHYNTIKLYEIIDNNDETLVSTISVLTKQLPNDILLPTVTDTTYEYFGKNLMLLMPALGTLPVAYDYNGDIRWYLTSNLTWAPTVLENGHLLLGTDKLLASPYYTTGLYEIDYLGKIYTEYILPGGYHHDVYEMSNGNFLVGTSDFEGTVEDKVVEIDRITGEIVKSWDISDYIPMTEGKSEMWTMDDWYHNNSISYDENTDSIILSGRHQDIIISIGYSSNKLNWIIGDPTNWSSELVQEYFFIPQGDDFEWSYGQHSATVLENGDIFLFDNGNNRSKLRDLDVQAKDNYSRGVIYSYNTFTMKITQKYQFGKELGEDFYSPYISNVFYYSEGNYLIHSGGHSEVDNDILNIPPVLSENFTNALLNSITIEVLNDEIVYRLEVPSNFYRAKKIMLYTNKTTFIVGSAAILGNYEITNTVDEDFKTVYNFFVTVPKKYDLDLQKQSDRLIISGVFNKYEDVYAVLVSNNDRLIYRIPTS
ncbi:MAG: aryl-sulfate sulfotransferase, partial [Candidatus Izimaplasma sp.]|nr:aryl-sulfate sulfotransferase [Candidatus Izimaplasma bacterium]